MLHHHEKRHRNAEALWSHSQPRLGPGPVTQRPLPRNAGGAVAVALGAVSGRLDELGLVGHGGKAHYLAGRMDMINFHQWLLVYNDSFMVVHNLQPSFKL